MSRLGWGCLADKKEMEELKAQQEQNGEQAENRMKAHFKAHFSSQAWKIAPSYARVVVKKQNARGPRWVSWVANREGCLADE